MIKQGDIISISFNPTKGREQQGKRPAVVVSNDDYNKISDFRVVFPISTTDRRFSLYVDLDDRTRTQGKVLGDQLRTVDIKARNHEFIEEIPSDILDDLLEIAQATFDKSEAAE
ncbi:MAG: type II toxin-antitoxin system PemK/MazF family toxin [Clostridiales bacterium]|nr:type II toxin-antitoxin system PemK/MazF family toxin [Clostridiales bacterium]